MLKRDTIAGSIESNDIMVKLFNDKGRTIELNSPVKEQFGAEIIKVVNDVLDEYKLNDVKVILEDRGALNYTIKARIKTAIQRGVE